MKRGLMAAVCSAAILGASGAQALTFSFEWSASDASVVTTTDPTATATGLIEIAVGAGEVFGLQDLVSISLTLVGDLIDTVLIDGSETVKFLEGEVAADGKSATLTDFLFSNVQGTSFLSGFGCEFAPPDVSEVCGATFASDDPRRVEYNIVSGSLSDGTGKAKTRYASADDALASFKLTEYVAPPDPEDETEEPSVIPLPGSAPLLLAGLGGLALWRRRRTA